MDDPKRNDGSQDSGPQVIAAWARQYVIVLEFLGSLAVLGYVGYALDEHYGWTPWGLLGGLLVALTYGVYRMIREGNRLNK